MNEVLLRDQNHVVVLGGVTDDSNQAITMLRVDPITKRLLVSASGLPGGGTVTSVSVVTANGFAGTVATPNSTPAITLETTVTGLLKGDGTAVSAAVSGTDYAPATSGTSILKGNGAGGFASAVSGTDYVAPGSILTSGLTIPTNRLLGRTTAGTGAIEQITVGSGLSLSGGVLSTTSSGSGYTTIENSGVAVTQRDTINLSNLLTASDSGGKTALTINTTNLGNDATLIATLESNIDLANLQGLLDLSTQVTGQLNASNINITDLESTLDLANIAGQINLTTQVTGQLDAANIDQASLDLSMIGGDLDLSTQVGTSILPLANGGTGANLSDPGYDAVYVWDDTNNETRLAQLSGLSYDSATNTLSSSGAGNKIAVDYSSISASSGGSYTVAIPGGTLGSSNAIKFKVLLDGVALSSGDTISVAVSYGGTSYGTQTISFRGAGSSFSGGPAFMDGCIVATGATNSQRGYFNWGAKVDTSDDTTIKTGRGTSAVDSTVSQDLVVTLSRASNGDVSAYGIIVERVS